MTPSRVGRRRTRPAPSRRIRGCDARNGSAPSPELDLGAGPDFEQVCVTERFRTRLFEDEASAAMPPRRGVRQPELDRALNPRSAVSARVFVRNERDVVDEALTVPRRRCAAERRDVAWSEALTNQRK